MNSVCMVRTPSDRDHGSETAGPRSPRKLGIKWATGCSCSGRRRASRRAPGRGEGEHASDGGVADVILAFHLRRAEPAKRMPALRERMEPAAGPWIAWPKRASKVETDLTEGGARARARQHARRNKAPRS